MTNKNSSIKFISAILSGLLLTCSFPSICIDWIVWFAIVPLLIASNNLSSKKCFYLGLTTGLAHYLTLIYWLIYTFRTYGNLPIYLCVVILLLLSVYLSFYIALFAVALSKLRRNSLIYFIMIPVLWVALEYVRSFFLTGFPWELIGHSQFENLTIIQISDIFGVYGVSFLIVLSNATLFSIFTYLAKENSVSKTVIITVASAFALIFGMAWFYGVWRIQSIDDLIAKQPCKRIAIIQGNIDQSQKWNPDLQVKTMQKYINLSFTVKKFKPDIIVWPETAASFYFLYDMKLSAMIIKAVNEANSDFLIGAPFFISKGKILEYYNSAYLINHDGNILGKYDKVHLVPFGEYVPFKKWLPFLGKMTQCADDFQSGDKGVVIDWNNYKIGAQICYEIIFPNLSRQMVDNGAELLINITNDAWFGNTSAPYQHFSMAVFRAIENKRSLVRSANTGISGFINPIGRIIEQTPIFQQAAITNSMPMLRTKTIYTRFGDVFAMLCLAAALVFTGSQLCYNK